MSNDLEYARVLRAYQSDPENPANSIRVANFASRIAGAIPNVDKAIQDQVSQQVAQYKALNPPAAPREKRSRRQSSSSSTCPPCPVKTCPTPPPCPIVTCPLPPPCPICPTALEGVYSYLKTNKTADWVISLMAIGGFSILAYSLISGK